MKKIILILFFISSGILLAQDREDIRKIVAAEFENAKGTKQEMVSNSHDSNSLMIRLGILLFASVASFGWVAYRRLKLKKNNGSQELKEKIKVLRTEKIKYEMDPRLKVIRKKLLETVPGSQIQFDTISNNAKRLNISKEEIAIASRLNMYSQKTVGGYIA